MNCSLLIDEMTWVEIRNRIESGWDSIIVPLGSTEQHGPALPLITDNAHGLETAIRAARILGQTFVGPVMTMGYSPEHTAFPGTVSLSKSTVAGLIHDIAQSHARSGFKFVYFWPGHGGNDPILQEVLASTESKWPPCCVTGLRNMADCAAKVWAAAPLALGIPPSQSGSHAGEMEASMMLSIAPSLVRMSAAEQGCSAPFETIAETMFTSGIQAVSSNGVLGDQRLANAERGNYYLDRLTQHLVTDFQNEKGKARQGK